MPEAEVGGPDQGTLTGTRTIVSTATAGASVGTVFVSYLHMTGSLSFSFLID